MLVFFFPSSVLIESDQHFFYFDTEGEKRTKKLVKYVRVRVEVEV